ncbi:RagB/SusD family nutrient uptake outer membrane protein [Larkinella rosea]|uniref:RagB/SusD family nutrient uptake outer membrane protein n=1 Tax=Larkinella rosea TaxID=2025312 RepID=A0A3P1BN61_9BACT|nr:RagB/SusD family nutrient uptake outer membrane protein [Larkinella rosea]RRB02511.1 RagB/SusD family nutrient uptake outer membrane protein [Larkinella rosea]
MKGLSKFGRKLYSSSINAILWVILLLTLGACKETLLDEVPKDSLNPDVVLTSKAGFENYLTALHQTARNEMILQDLTHYFDQNIGTDIATTGQEPAVNFRNYNTYLIPDNPVSRTYWDWGYANMLNIANTLIVYANRPESKAIWAAEAEKNAVIAEARFFRAYTHNLLANLYGGVPIVDTVYTGPKTDFVRNTRKQVYESARADLEFAAKWLPETVVKAKEGRVVKAAADHLLSEVYISLGEYDKAVEAASRVIGSGVYKLMTDRFGTEKDKPGDVFSDLFKDGNQNRSSGNLESIFVWQFENLTPGGGGSRGNHNLRGWGPFYINLKDPDNKAGMVIVDSLGRGVGWVRPTTFFLYDLWKDNAADMRNSPYNIRRTNYYTNSASKYFKMPVEKKKSLEDTMQNLYPTILKVEGKPWANNNTSGQTAKDVMVYRLAETYLLRAEAYLRKGDLQKAADDLNAVRKRANAKPVSASAVTIDFVLDERARELITEEPRRRTLMRMGKLVERVRKYNMRESTRTTIQEKHELFPIPQTAIDANFSVKLEQNPGY